LGIGADTDAGALMVVVVPGGGQWIPGKLRPAGVGKGWVGPRKVQIAPVCLLAALSGSDARMRCLVFAALDQTEWNMKALGAVGKRSLTCTL
jgi:hypothetical protein